MGDKSPKNQIKIGNITVKLNPNNPQKIKKESTYDGNYYKERYNDKYNDRYNDRYTDKYNRYNDKNKRRNRDRDYNYRNNKNYDYDNDYNKNKNYRNKSKSKSRSRSRRDNFSHKYHSRNNNYKSKSRSRSKSLNRHKNDNDIINKNNNNNNINNKNNEPKDEKNGNDNKNNQMPMNQFPMNQMQNYFNNYMNMNGEFFKKLYQMNNNNQNQNSSKIFVPIGIPINYFYGNMSQDNKMNFNNNINKPNNNQNIQNNIQIQNSQKEKEKEKEEPSNTILITDLDTNITKDILEDIFREKCLQLQISLPIDIRLIEALNIAYIIFPSVTSCVVVFNSLSNKKILINGKNYPVQFSPNLTKNYNNNRNTLTYVTQISSDKNLTTSMETTVHEDWYCVYCNSKNFSRRIVCFKCQKPKSINCRVVPVIKQKKIILGKNGEILPNNSIIIQGKQIMNSNEGEVFIIYLFKIKNLKILVT